MNATTILQLVTALAALLGQLTPLALALKAAIESGDDAQVDALLKRLQAVNDQLGAAP